MGLPSSKRREVRAAAREGLRKLQSTNDKIKQEENEQNEQNEQEEHDLEVAHAITTANLAVVVGETNDSVAPTDATKHKTELTSEDDDEEDEQGGEYEPSEHEEEEGEEDDNDDVYDTKLMRKRSSSEQDKPSKKPKTLQSDEVYIPPKQTRTIFKLDDPTSSQCEYCGKEFRNVIDKRNHRRTHSQPKIHVCYCGKQFSQKPNLIIHQTTVHRDLQLKEEQAAAAAAAQAAQAATAASAAASAAQAAAQAATQVTSDPTETSSTYPQQYPDLKQVRVLHCDVLNCTKGFLTYEQLLEHKQQDHSIDVTGNPESATTTTSSSTTSSSKKTYKKPKSVRSHACPHPGCDRAFTKKSDLTRHIRVHTGERPYVCEYCHASFNQKYRLTTHLRIHTGEKPFSCQYCGKSFARGDAVQSHVFSVHRAKGEAF